MHRHRRRTPTRAARSSPTASRRPTATPNDTPWWAEYDVTNLWQDFADRQRHARGPAASATTTSPAARRNDLILGELGNDTIQGDGSIDYVSPGQPDDRADGGIPAVAARRRLRHGAGCTDRAVNPICDPTGASSSTRRSSARTDGEDYIEGNGGNDVVFGGLGQDDIVGGSSDFFSLTRRQAARRRRLRRSPTLPRVGDVGRDLIFGGAGTQIGYDNGVDTPARGRAR